MQKKIISKVGAKFEKKEDKKENKVETDYFRKKKMIEKTAIILDEKKYSC